MSNQWNSPTQQPVISDDPNRRNGFGHAAAEQHPIADRYNTHDASFRRHYQLNYRGNGHSYDEFYAPAYRFGFELGEESATTWDEVEAAAQRHWETNHPSAWAEVVDAVHYGWLEERNPEALRVHHYGEYDTYRAGFQNHYLETNNGAGAAFDHYEPAYQYGYNLAIDPAYNTRDWTEMEPEVRKYYETEYADAQLPWERYREAVRHAWHGVRATAI